MKIMKTRILLLLGLIILISVSCETFLEPYPRGYYTEEDIWDYPQRVEGLINRSYDLMATNYNDNEGAYFDGATDNGVITSTNHALQRMATGTLLPGSDPFRTYWNRDYEGIYLVNLFLKDERGYQTRYIVDEDLDILVRRRLQGEAYALRAWFQWDLLQKFGGKGQNGELLGFPIVTEPMDPNDPDINLARNTYEECVQQIVSDIEAAQEYLPIAHRDFLVPSARERLYAGGKYWGRMDGITMTALKANLYLTWASPRFNPGNDMSRWDIAAKSAKEVIDFKLNVDNVSNGFNPANEINWFDPNFPGIVISSRYLDNNEYMERLFYPGGFAGNGAIGASQQLVDAFPMANGYPITDPASGYDPENPYEGRDPRFYNNIFYNTAEAKRGNTGAVMYTFENWTGGKDAAGRILENSKTNYHIKKFVYMGWNASDANIARQPHSKFFIRWTHMILAFAEAANHVVGPDDEGTYGLSAKKAVQYLRSRNVSGSAGISPAPPAEPDAYLAGINTKEAFDALVKNERRITTCFEGIRFFDLSRWTTDLAQFNQSVKGMGITKNEDGTFVYNPGMVVEERKYNSAYLPIPYSEILKMSNLVQNEGWSGWN